MARQYKTGLIITGDASGGIKAVRATEKELGQLNRRFDSGSQGAKRFSQASSGVSREMQALKRLAAPVGAALAGMFAVNSLREQVNFADQLQKTNLRIGASTEALSQYAHVANLADVQFNQLTTAWQRQSRRIAQAAQDTGEAKDALAALNLDAGELARLAPEDQFERIAEAMSGVAGEAQRVAYAQKIWDSEGVKLLQIVNQGTDAIRAQREEAERLGLTISQDTAEAMAGFNDEMARLQAVGTGLSRQILSELVPAMTSGMQATSEWIEEVGGAAQILDTTKDVAAALAAVLAGRLAGSLALAATRLTATAGAAGVLRGALMAVGGPIGLLVGGAGLLYAFREELNLVKREASNAATRINQLTASIATMGATEATANLAKARNEMRALADQGNNLRRVLRDMRPGDTWDGRTYEQLWDQFRLIQDEAGLARDAVKKLEDAVDEAGQIVEVTTPELEDLNDGLETVAATTVAAAKATGDHTSELDALRNKLVPGRRETIQYAKDMNTLNLAFAAGKIGVSEYLALQGRLAESMASAGDDVRDLADKNTDAADEMTREWERFGNSVDDTFKDAFKGAFDSFDDFADQLKGAFENLLAELAYAAVKNEIKIQLGMQASGPMQGGISDIFGGGQNGNGFSLNSINLDSIQKGWDTASSWFSGSSGASAGSGGIYATANTGAAQGGLYGNVQTGGVQAGGVDWQSGLMNAGYAYAGGYAGTEIGEAAFGKTANSNYGQMIGTAIGSYILPGIGTAIGSFLGSAADVLFGSGEKDFDFDFEQGGHYGVFGDRESAFGKFGITDFSDYKKGEQQDQLNELMTSIADFDNVLASAAVPERFEAMKSAVEGFTHSDPESLFEDRLRTIIESSGAIVSGAVNSIEDPQKLSEAFLAVLEMESVGQTIAGELIAGAAAEIDSYDTSGEISGAVTAMSKATKAAAVLSYGADHLGLQFDATADGAIHAASNLQEMSGGVQNLASMQQAYFSNYFSQSEQATLAFADVYDALSDVTDKVPETKAEFRDLVEAQNLNTDAGMETFTALMKLAPAWSQMAASLEDALGVAYQNALGREIDTDGLDYYTSKIESGALTLEEALGQIANSAEAAEFAASGAAEVIRDFSAAINARAALDRQLLELQGDTQALRELELAELREIEGWKEKGLVSAQERIWALEDEREAVAQAASAARDRERAAQEARQAYLRELQAAENTVRQLYNSFANTAFDQEIALLEILGDEQAIVSLQRERELEAIDESLRPIQEHIWALQDEAKAQQEAAQAATDYATAVAELAGALSGIGQWVDTQRATGQSPGNNLTASGDQFARQLALAESGDRQALQSITQYADQYLAAGRDMYASGSGFQSIEQDVIAALEGLPEALTDAEYIVEGFRDIVSQEMADEIERAILESQYTIDTLITFAANADDLPGDLRAILGEQAHRLDSTLNYLIGTNELDSDLRTLALKASNNLVSTIDLIAGSDIRVSDRRLALESSNLFTSTINLALGSDLTEQNRRLALRAGNTYSVTTDLILGSDLSAADRTLALTSGHTYATAVELVLRKNIDSGSRTLALAGGNTYESLVEYAVRKDISAADRKLALTTGNRYTSTLDLILGRNLSADNRTLALEANNLYTSSVDLVLRKNISEQNRRLALRNGSTYRTLMDYALRKDVTAADRTLALAGGNTYATVLDIALGEDITPADRTLALEHANDYLSTIDLVLGGDITGEERRLALEDANSYRGTINLVLGADVSGNDRILALESGSVYKTLLDYRRRKNISGADRRLALNAGNTYRSTIELALGKDTLSAGDRTLALESANAYASTVDLILGSDISASDRTLALERSHTYATAVELALRKDISADSRTLALAGGNTYQALVEYAVDKDVSDADRRLALKSSNRYATQLDYYLRKDVSTEDRALALRHNNAYTSTIDLILGKNISAENRKLALKASNTLDATVNASLGKVNAAARSLGLKSANYIQTTIGAVIASDVTPAERKLALQNANRLTTTVNSVLASGVSDDELGLALNAANSISTTISASMASDVTPNERKLALGNANRIQTTIAASIAKGVDAKTRKLALGSGNRIQTTVAGVLGRNLPDDVETLALKQANSFTTTLNAALADGTIDDDERKLLDARSEQIVKTLLTGGNLNLSADERAVIAAASGQKKLDLLADVAFKADDLKELEDIAGSTDETGKNTGSLISRTEAQLNALGTLNASTLKSVQSVVDLNLSVKSLNAAIADLENIGDSAGGSTGGNTGGNAGGSAGSGGNTGGSAGNSSGTSPGVYQYRMGQVDEFWDAVNSGPGTGMTPRAILKDWIGKDGGYGRTYWATFNLLGSGANMSIDDRIGLDITENHRFFAKGGTFTNGIVDQPTSFSMGLMGEAGPEAIMPLTRHGDGSLGVRAELPALPPLLGQGDVVEVLRDLKREVAELRRENAKLQGEGNKHAAASVQVQQAGFTRSIEEQRRGNRSLGRMVSGARLEASQS